MRTNQSSNNNQGYIREELVRKLSLKLTMGFNNRQLQVFSVFWELPNITIKQHIKNWFVGN